MKTKSCQAPGSIGLIPASLPACRKERLFRTGTSFKAHFRPFKWCAFQFSSFSGEIQESAHSGTARGNRAYEATAAVLSLRAVYLCSSHGRNLRVIVRSKRLLRGRNRAPQQPCSSWHRKLWRMLWDYWKDIYLTTLGGSLCIETILLISVAKCSAG